MKTNKNDFIYFVKKCKYYIDLFGLKDWKFYFNHYLETDAYASCDINDENRIATINLSTELHSENTDDKFNINKKLNELAFHEVCHVLLSDLCYLTKSKKVNSIEHSIIRRLEKAFESFEK